MHADSRIGPPIVSRPPGKRLFLVFLSLFFVSTLLFGQGDGKWLHRVPDEDHARHNPLAHQPQAIAAGRSLFAANCAKCHNADANGRTNPYRPSLRSERIRHATDGDLFWMLKNGNPYKGMPQWWSLPEEQRWQIITYLRSLPPQHK
ncbi:MAG TPA: cytochrome c [Acidobacteriaceae bacterium]|nr:cytochrome c [Acidobacteriaceae bacterium]